MDPNSNVLENGTYFSKPVGPISHVFVGLNSYKSGGTRHVPPNLYYLLSSFIPKYIQSALIFNGILYVPHNDDYTNLRIFLCACFGTSLEP